ncbi:hypothetical protein FRC09_000199, partial [Ceratobasidium sp. 395]
MLTFSPVSSPKPRLSWRSSKLLFPGRLLPTSVFQPPPPAPCATASEYWLPEVVWVPPKRRSYAESRASPSPVGTPLYDRLSSQTQEYLPHNDMAIGQIRALPTPSPSPAPGASNSQGSSPGSGSLSTTTTATPVAYPRPLPLLPSRSQSQLALPLESTSRAPSRSPSPSPRNTLPAVPTSGSIPLPPTAPNPSHPLPPLPPLPPRPTITTTSSSITLATTASSAPLTATSSLEPVTPSSAGPVTAPSSISYSGATSGHGAPAEALVRSESDLIKRVNEDGITTRVGKEDVGAREIPQVMVHEVDERSMSEGPMVAGVRSDGGPHTLDMSGLGASSHVEASSSSSLSTSQMQTAPASPYLTTSGQVSPAISSPLVPPSPASTGGISPHSTGGGLSPHPSTGLPSPSSPGGFAARFGKKKRQLSKDLLKRGPVSCEDLRIHVGGTDGEVIRMIPQHHMQTMGLQHQQSPKQANRNPELAQDRNWGVQQPPPSSPTHRPPKLNLGITNVFSSRARKESTQGGSSSAGGVLNLRRPSTPGTSVGFGFTAGGQDTIDESNEGPNPAAGGSLGKRGSGSTPGIGSFFGGSPSNKEKRPNPPSPPPKPAKLKAQGILNSAFGLGMSVAGAAGRGSMMPNSPSIAAAIEYMRHEHERDPRGSISTRRALGTSTSDGKSVDEHGRHSESASDVSGPSSSVASLLSANTGTGTSASEVVDAKMFGQLETYDADISNVNTPQPSNQLLDATTSDPTLSLFPTPPPLFSSNPQARPQSPAMQDPDKRISTASSQRTLMPWNTSKRESGIFVFPTNEHGTPLARVHTTDGVSPSSPDPTTMSLPAPDDQAEASYEKPIPRPVRLGQLSGSLKRRSASMSILLPRAGDTSDSSAREVPLPLPPRRILPTDGVVTDSEGYMSSASNAGGYLSSASNSSPGEVGGRKRMQGGIKGKIAAWTAAAEAGGRRKHHARTAGSSVGHAHTDLEPRRSDSPHQHQALVQGQGQGYPYSHSPASAPTLQVHTHLHLPSQSHNQTPLMTIAALAPAARDLALGVGKRVEKFYRARSASGAGHGGEAHPMMRGASQGSSAASGMRVASPGSGIGGNSLEPSLPVPIRPAVPGASGLVFGRSLDDPGLLKDTDGWVDESIGGVKRCVGLPVIVSRCVRYLEKWGGDEEGLFRISGRPSHVARLRAEFDAGADYELSEVHPSDLDPHAVSSLFKAYLRELPDLILTRALKYQFDLAMTSTSDNSSSFDLTKLPTSMTSFGESSEHMRPLDDSLIADIKLLVDQLPQINYVLLHEICHLLRYTAQHAQTTKMPLGNLLLLFCPTLGFSAGFLRCLVEGQERLFEWGRVGPAPPPLPSRPAEPAAAAVSQPDPTPAQIDPVPSQPAPAPPLPPRKPVTAASSNPGTIKHAASASMAPASLRSLKSPLNIATDLVPASPRTRSQTTVGTGSNPPSRASMFFPNLGPRRPSITMLFGGGNSNRNSRDTTPRQSTGTSSEEESLESEDLTEGLVVNPKRVTRPPRVSLDIPDGSFAPSLSPPKPGAPIPGIEQAGKEPSPAKEESPAKRGNQTPIADLFKSPLTAA